MPWAVWLGELSPHPWEEPISLPRLGALGPSPLAECCAGEGALLDA